VKSLFFSYNNLSIIDIGLVWFHGVKKTLALFILVLGHSYHRTFTSCSKMAAPTAAIMFTFQSHQGEKEGRGGASL